MSTHVAVITISDRSAAGLRPDRSGPVACDALTEAGHEVTARLVADDVDAIRTAVRSVVEDGARVVVTLGGTGLGARDRTPEATEPLIVRPLPGIAEALRRAGADTVPTAVLSRGVAGVVQVAGRQSVVVNAAGSPGAARDAIAVLLPLIDHLVDQLDGGDHV